MLRIGLGPICYSFTSESLVVILSILLRPVDKWQVRMEGIREVRVTYYVCVQFFKRIGLREPLIKPI